MLKRLIALAFLSAAPLVRAEREVSLGDYSREARNVILERVRGALAESGAEAMVVGTVTYAGDDNLFIQMADDGLKVVFADGAARKCRGAAAGDTVEIVGRPALEGGRVVFLASAVRKTGTAALPKPVVADASALTRVGEGKDDVNWLVVEVTGRAIGLTENGFAIDVEGTPVTVVAADRPAFLDDCEQTHPKVRVRGVAELVLDQSALFRPARYVMGVKLNASAADDIGLLPDAAYLLARRDRRMTLAVGALIVLLALALAAAAVIVFRQRRRHFRTETLMAERKRMADDIHDTIEQHLVGAGMLVKLGRAKEALDVLVRAKREIRDIVWGLKNDDMMRLTPSAMVRELARDETRKGLCHVEARLSGLPPHLDAAAMRDLSLIVREAIGNAVKHGGAKKIAISSDPREGGGWLLRIANDGAPFDPAKVPGPAEGHFGLEGMRERARRLHATVDFSAKGMWTVLSVEARK